MGTTPTVEQDINPDDPDGCWSQRKAYWFCDECGHADHQRMLPPDREAFYKNAEVRLQRLGYSAYACPKCKSMAFMPKGF